MTEQTSSYAPVPLAEVEQFDHTTDVVVVGYGLAGAAAAIEAARAGASVTLLERFSGPGGSSAQSGGELYLGGGTRVQKALGIEDSVEAMEAYLVAALGPHADEEKIRLYSQGSVEHFDWFDAMGVDFHETLWESTGWMPFTNDGLMWLGENAWPYTEIATPAPRGHRPPAPGFAGGALMEKVTATVEAEGVDVRLDTRALALVVDETGAVVGLRAKGFAGETTIRATKGVVLTTGGFVDNERMLADHAPDLLGHGKVSDGGDDGSGIEMGIAAGAATRRMSAIEVSLTFTTAMASRGILVNALGQRFVTEDTYPGVPSHAALHQPGPVWVIMDEEGFDSLSTGETWGAQPKHAAETVEELESDLGLPAGSLAHTIALYNEGAARGEDPLFHKNATWVHELKAPFAAFDPADMARAAGSSTTGFSGFTLGGLHTDVDGRVRRSTGGFVPGLYAAGRAASGMHGYGYVSGTSLGDGSFFGRRAGRAAAGA
ncbi:MAG: FAD-dependent oxidoreductase [Nocardioides sp.]|uniref:FAD-dependent oxidoreductase n=1 Tax=Nocardioides sp. TaxID=35761 RepID=UPI003F1100F9